MPRVKAWQTELDEIADRLEAGAMQWRLDRASLDHLDNLSDSAGTLRMVGPWTAIPHAEIVMENVVAPLRKLANHVPEPPEAYDDA